MYINWNQLQFELIIIKRLWKVKLWFWFGNCFHLIYSDFISFHPPPTVTFISKQVNHHKLTDGKGFFFHYLIFCEWQVIGGRNKVLRKLLTPRKKFNWNSFSWIIHSHDNHGDDSEMNQLPGYFCFYQGK